MAKTATELLLEGVEMATNNGDRTEEIPDDAVADHIGPVEAYRHRLTVAVNNHRHHIAGAQIHPQPQRRFRRGRRLVTQRCRRLQTWGVMPQVSVAMDKAQGHITSGDTVRIIFGVATIIVAGFIAWSQVRKHQKGMV